MTAIHAIDHDPCFDNFCDALDADAEEITRPTRSYGEGADALPYVAPKSRTERYLLIRERARLHLRSRASLGFVDSPCCSDPGPHEDDGSRGAGRGFLCCCCGMSFGLDEG